MGAATTVPGGAAATNNQSPLSEIAQVGTAGASSGADQSAVMAAASMPLSAFGATATTMIGAVLVGAVHALSLGSMSIASDAIDSQQIA